MEIKTSLSIPNSCSFVTWNPWEELESHLPTRLCQCHHASQPLQCFVERIQTNLDGKYTWSQYEIHELLLSNCHGANTFMRCTSRWIIVYFILKHLVEGGVGVEEDEDPLRDDLALNPKVVLCGTIYKEFHVERFRFDTCSVDKWNLDEVSELSAIHFFLFPKHHLKI